MEDILSKSPHMCRVSSVQDLPYREPESRWLSLLNSWVALRRVAVKAWAWVYNHVQYVYVGYIYVLGCLSSRPDDDEETMEWRWWWKWKWGWIRNRKRQRRWVLMSVNHTKCLSSTISRRLLGFQSVFLFWAYDGLVCQVSKAPLKMICTLIPHYGSYLQIHIPYAFIYYCGIFFLFW